MKSLLAAASLAATLLASPASATLVGETVSVAYYFPDAMTVYGSATPSSPLFLVGGGVESTVDVEGVTFIDVDFGASSLELVFNTVLGSPTWNSVPFNGLIFSSAGFGQITGWSIDPGTTFGIGSFDPSDITLVGNDLRLNWQGISYADGQVLKIDFATSAVPEPATWALLILGFGLVGAAHRWQRAAA